MTMKLYNILKEQREKIRTLKEEVNKLDFLSEVAKNKIIDGLNLESTQITKKINDLQW